MDIDTKNDASGGGGVTVADTRPDAWKLTLADRRRVRIGVRVDARRGGGTVAGLDGNAVLRRFPDR